MYTYWHGKDRTRYMPVYCRHNRAAKSNRSGKDPRCFMCLVTYTFLFAYRGLGNIHCPLCLSGPGGWRPDRLQSVGLASNVSRVQTARNNKHAMFHGYSHHEKLGLCTYCDSHTFRGELKLRERFPGFIISRNPCSITACKH